MSLINDALRRTSQAKKEQPPNSGGAPMQPVNPPPQSKIPIFGPILVIVLLAVLLSLASWLFWKSWQAKSTPSVVSTEPTPPAQASARLANAVPDLDRTSPSLAPPVSNQESKSDPVATRIPTPEEKTDSPPETLAESTNATAPISPNTNVTVAVQTVPTPAPPALKLQGIFYRVSNPTAMINGRSVAVGDTISGGRVIKIDKEEVIVERNGETTVLTLR
ncbi:MAG: hypothetical protein ABIR24_01060 [Verrucomicrobiota bacterium]